MRSKTVSWAAAEAAAVDAEYLIFHTIAADGDVLELVGDIDGGVHGRLVLSLIGHGPLLLHVLKLEPGFGFDDVAADDSSEDPDSDPCCAFPVPAFLEPLVIAQGEECLNGCFDR
ncbi:hypothetical protein F0562_010595 [Nyssa sinensis]|uniref:Uncharacterized protein n=1 Tax=Nyssa sinensis TaxID=561372 RepID=A0A5J4ZYR8_9ASTE|nr:hypothetical protein F0562_010595 [Nyssa sinensis]